MRTGAILMLSAGLVLAGCADYSNHRDTITLRAGDAIAADRAIQTIDPWPPAAFRTTTRYDGRRIERTMDRFYGSVLQPGGKGPPESAATSSTAGGNCDCPDDRAADGSLCGARSAYSRSGGRSPVCSGVKSGSQ